MRNKQLPMDGHFGIGVYKGKNEINLGVLWRGAYQLGASYIFTVGERYKKDSGDVYKTWLRVPLFQFETFEEMKKSAPRDCPIVAIESGGTPLPSFEHPLRAVYLLGAEDGGIPRDVIDQCHQLVTIPSIRTDSYTLPRRVRLRCMTAWSSWENPRYQDRNLREKTAIKSESVRPTRCPRNFFVPSTQSPLKLVRSAMKF